ncbi:hypothetical protein I4F81_011425 [Pyropia yezoensis]|uniref:Uncharacterized protein n=1 Tax=Pyropia yezoensis TaxID=2788 RepID=A0ACC3CFT4_PYRYE|nr:hypothetical protein I4F81_011425 [Neopyropia yezoensis]
MATTVRRRVARRAAVQRPPPRRVCACQAPPAPVSPARPRGAGGSNAGCARLLRTIEWVGGGGLVRQGVAHKASAHGIFFQSAPVEWHLTHTHGGGGAEGALPPTLVAGRMGLSHGCRCCGGGEGGGPVLCALGCIRSDSGRGGRGQPATA